MYGRKIELGRNMIQAGKANGRNKTGRNHRKAVSDISSGAVFVFMVERKEIIDKY